MVRITRYQDDLKYIWDEFSASAANSTFLHQRNYMDYHRDRFADHSLLFFENEKLIALLPCNERNGSLHSHGGLTYGGLLTLPATRTAHVLDIFSALHPYLSRQGLNGLYYKPVPTLFHRHRTEGDLYALFQHKAVLTGRDISTAINLHHYQFPARKMNGVRKAVAAGVTIEHSVDFDVFFQLVNRGLESRYGVKATHTANEMRKLHAAFPDNIRLLLALQKNEVIGGALLYACGPALHAQYIAQSEHGMKLRCLDLLVHHITSTASGFSWFSFGISSENKGEYTNIGLLNSKEEYMTTSICFDYYHLPAPSSTSTSDHHHEPG